MARRVLMGRSTLEARCRRWRPHGWPRGSRSSGRSRWSAAPNGNLFKVAKGIGSTAWHTHEDQEETFLLLHGRLTIQLRSGDVHLEPGDLFVIPRGVEHCPVAQEEAYFLLVGQFASAVADLRVGGLTL